MKKTIISNLTEGAVPPKTITNRDTNAKVKTTLSKVKVRSNPIVDKK